MWQGLGLAVYLICSTAALAADVTDATGRTVTVPEPDQISRVLPAGPPAAVLLEAIAPDLMLGWPGPVSGPARAVLPPIAAALPQVPRLTGREEAADKLAELHPDLILDYGDVTPRYIDLDKTIERKTGIPTLLFDGSMDKIPAVIRTLGSILGREDRAEAVAQVAEALLSLPVSDAHPTVLYARGPTGGLAAAPGTEVTAVFTRLGWTVRAPKGEGTFRPVTVQAIAALDPDWLVFADPAMADVLAHDAGWQGLRAVRDGHAVIAPHLPFGWVEEPPSINRLLGFAWLSGRDPILLAAVSNAILYGRTLTPVERRAVLQGVAAIHP